MVSISVKLNKFKSLLKLPVFAISLKDFLLYLFFFCFSDFMAFVVFLLVSCGVKRDNLWCLGR